jgi:hypothetical protein
MIPSKKIDWNSEEVKQLAAYKKFLEDSTHAIRQHFRGVLTLNEVLDHLEQDNAELNSVLSDLLNKSITEILEKGESR